MSLSAKLAEYHPVVIEGMGGYDTRDPNVIADHLTQRLKAHWAVKPPGKPLVVLTQGDPLEPSGISAITPLVAKQLNAPRALVYLDQEIADYHWRDADRRDMVLEIKYSLLVAEVNERIPGSMAAIMDAIDQQLAEKNTERLMLKKTPLKDYYRDFALLQEVTKVASFQLSGELTMIHTSPRISPDSVTSFCRVGFTLGLVDQSDRVAYDDSDPAE